MAKASRKGSGNKGPEPVKEDAHGTGPRREKALEAALQQIEKSYGKGSIMKLGDGEIARILNMKKLSTPRGLRWTQDRVQAFRAHHRIRKAKQRAAAEDVLTGQQAREYLGIGYNGLVALIRRGVLHTNQVTDFAPWRIPRAELDSEQAQDLVRALKANGRLPPDRGSPDFQASLFPEKSSIL